jgi:GGDEF domain-containing protein
MCDVDRFKAINDRFGHEFGDKVLVQIAGVLRSFESKVIPYCSVYRESESEVRKLDVSP